MKKKIMFVFGTRPELIKLLPLIKSMNQKHTFNCINVSTGQHDEMLKPLINNFSLTVNYDLSIMKDNQSITEITNSILSRIESILNNENPDMVVVHGDTTTAFAAGLASSYKKIPVAHVEAGLRSGDAYSPFPEEINRQLIDRLATLYFCPTERNKETLIKENIDEDNIVVTGNTSIDMFQYTLQSDYTHELLERFKNKKIILFTMHRRENIGEPMKSAFQALNRLLEENSDTCVIFPIHYNPKVRALASEYLKKNDRLAIIQPLDVIDFHNFLNKSYLIMTDSGGIQEEAPFLGVPTIIMRNETERQEALSIGINYLVGTTEISIYEKVSELLNDPVAYKRVANRCSPYGDGHASERISYAVEKYIKKVKERDLEHVYLAR